MIPEQTFETYPVFGDNATKVQPDATKYAAGFQPADVLPAEWENWAWNKNTTGITDLNRGLSSVEKELINILTEAGITPSEATEDQIKSALIVIIGNNNSATATKLKTKRKINNTDFDGSADITTTKWGTARTIKIQDNDGTNTESSGTSIDGSADKTLKLPATIKASITGTCSGNAGSATKLQTARNINGTSFNGSADITTAQWGTARNITISDSDGTNSGTAVSVNGSAAATLKLPSTIKASLTGNCSGSAGTLEGKTYRQTAFTGLYITTDTSALSATSYTFAPTAPAGSTALEAGSTIRVTFKYALQSSSNITSVAMNYGGRSGLIKATRGGALVNVAAHLFSGGEYSSTYPYKVWDAYTTLELMWTGSEWLIIGDPVLCSYASDNLNYTIKGNGFIDISGYNKPSAYQHTVSFPLTFTYAPEMTAVVTNPNSDVTTNVTCVVMLYSVSTTQFSAKARNESGSGTSQSTSGYCYRAFGY